MLYGDISYFIFLVLLGGQHTTYNLKETFSLQVTLMYLTLFSCKLCPKHSKYKRALFQLLSCYLGAANVGLNEPPMGLVCQITPQHCALLYVSCTPVYSRVLYLLSRTLLKYSTPRSFCSYIWIKRTRMDIMQNSVTFFLQLLSLNTPI